MPKIPKDGTVFMKKEHGSSSSKSAGKAGKSLFTEIGSIVVFASAIFTLFALLTYDPNDPSILSNSQTAPMNACGKVGALIASAVLQWFGMGGFLFPAALLFIAATIYKREGSVRVFGRMGGMSVAVISATVFLSLQWKYWPHGGSLLLTGGAFGAWISDLLVQQFNALGSSIVSLVMFCLALALSTPLSIAQFGAQVLKVVGTWSYRVGRMVGTYLLYLAGLLGMRAAHAAGDLLQMLIEGAANRARQKRETKAQIEDDSDDEEEEVEAEVADGAPKQLELKKTKKLPEIGVAAVAKAATEAVDALADPAIPFEAPNALPELESKAPPTKAKPVQLPIPEILPPENFSDAPIGANSPIDVSSMRKVGDDAAAEKKKVARAARAKRGQWKLPLVDFLAKVEKKNESAVNKEQLYKNSEILRQTFLDFGIEGEVTAVRPGPVITLYEFKPGPGVKVSKIASLSNDISMMLAAQSVRILAPLPGKNVVGIEIPSEHREKVFMREFVNDDFYSSKMSIPVVMGKDIGGQSYLADLARMPHLLTAGQTGSGKSVFMNGLICSLFYRFTPDELRMILIDPKFIEFTAYQDIPHLLLPVVDDPKNASTALKWAVREMERRYRILAMMNAKNLAAYNQKVEEMGVDTVKDIMNSEENQPEGHVSGGDWIRAFEDDEEGEPRIGKLPYIVIIIDELADLMMIAKKEVEVSIARIAQKARAAGIHLVIATQRPSTDVVTGLIKANLPSRASFRLASYIDSKTILDGSGAERLLGQGDMLFIPPGTSSAIRLHGAYMDDDEIAKIVSFLKDQGKPVYRDEILKDEEEEGADGEGGEDEQDDTLFTEAVHLVRTTRQASASYIQRHLKVGYNRAARMIETMESRGMVGPADGSRPREVLMP